MSKEIILDQYNIINAVDRQENILSKLSATEIIWHAVMYKHNEIEHYYNKVYEKHKKEYMSSNSSYCFKMPILTQDESFIKVMSDEVRIGKGYSPNSETSSDKWLEMLESEPISVGRTVYKKGSDDSQRNIAYNELVVLKKDKVITFFLGELINDYDISKVKNYGLLENKSERYMGYNRAQIFCNEDDETKFYVNNLKTKIIETPNEQLDNLINFINDAKHKGFIKAYKEAYESRKNNLTSNIVLNKKTEEQNNNVFYLKDFR